MAMSTRNAPALSLPDRISGDFWTIKDVAPSVVLISFNSDYKLWAKLKDLGKITIYCGKFVDRLWII
jgi:hypothetical protein